MGISKRLSNLKKLFNAFSWHFKRRTKKQFKSRGEALIRSWLAYSNVRFEEQYELYLPQLGTKTNLAYIDFVVKRHDGKKFAIEFNGKQHYAYVPFFHKGGIFDLEKQQYRDQIVKEWCIDNGYTFIEIPYTCTTNDIVNILKENFD